MKKLIAFILTLSMLLSTAALAEDLGIQVIGGPNVVAEPLSLDDMKLGETYTIDGYAKVKLVEYQVVDFFAQFNKDANYANVGGNKNPTADHVFVDHVDRNWYYNWRWHDAKWNDSGLNADFMWLMADFINIQKKDFDFTKEATVKVIYQDEYEFGGWVRQINYDYINYGSKGRDVSRYEWDSAHPNVVVMNPANAEAIGMMYTGTYVFGATLPNSVFEDTKSPLQMIITVDGNELTYNIRK